MTDITSQIVSSLGARYSKWRQEAENEITQLRDALAKKAEEIDALRKEIDHIKQVEFPRRVDKAVAGWRKKCERLEKEADKFGDGIDWIQRAFQAEAKLQELEEQEPVGEWVQNRFLNHIEIKWNDSYRVSAGDKLYAHPQHGTHKVVDEQSLN